MTTDQLAAILDQASISQTAPTDHWPEFAALKDKIENQGWHVSQSVLDHSLLSLKGYDELVATGTVPQLVTGQIGDVDKATLLRLAILLHDIGKLEVLVTLPDGTTIAANHGPSGAEVARPVLEATPLPAEAVAYITGLIHDHLLPSDVVDETMELRSDEVLDRLRQRWPQTWFGLLLLSYADTFGCVCDDVIGPIAKARMERIKALIGAAA